MKTYTIYTEHFSVSIQANDIIKAAEKFVAGWGPAKDILSIEVSDFRTPATKYL